MVRHRLLTHLFWAISICLPLLLMREQILKCFVMSLRYYAILVSD
jgi:hypothetical protein